jgi:capsid protein
VREYADYVKVTQHEIAAGLGVTREDMTGDYANLPFSAARMSRLTFWAGVEGWRWRMLEPQFLNPIWTWSAQAAMLTGISMPARTAWTAPGMPWIEPDKEAGAIMQLVRAGLSTLSEELRRRGIHAETHWDEYQADQEDRDRRGIVVDTDARYMTQQGQRQGDVQPGRPADASASSAALLEFGRLLAKFPEDEQEAMMAKILTDRGNGNGSGARA